MKYHILLLAAIICSGICGKAQRVMEIKSGDFVDRAAYETPVRQVEESDSEITVTYTFSHLMVDSISHDGAYSIWIPQFGSCYKPGFPSLPAKLDAVEVPFGCEPILVEGEVVYEDYFMDLSPSSELFTENGEMVSSPKGLPSSGFLPKSIAIISNLQKYKGHNICHVNVYPVKYDQNTKTMQVATKLTYTVKYVPMAMALSMDAEEDVQETDALNGIVLNSIGDIGDIPFDSESTYQVDIPRDYLILSTTAMKSAITRFAEWKKALGFTVHEVYKDKWNSDSDVKDSIDFYYSRYPGIDYLLIVGNHDQVPAMKVRNFNEHLTDLYYGSKYYTFQYLPEKYRGRIPVQNKDQAANALEKIIAYEVCENIPCDDFFNTSLHCAMFETDGDNNHQRMAFEKARFIQTSEEIIKTVQREGITPYRCYHNPTAFTPQYYSIDRMFTDTSDFNNMLMPDCLRSEDFDWNSSTDKVSEIMKKGVHMAVYRGHGFENGWQYPIYITENIKKDTYAIKYDSNSRSNEYLHPVIFSVTCSTGNYSLPECFASAALNQQYGGGAAVIGSSEMSYSGFNDAMILGFFDTFYPDSVLTTYITTDARYFSKKTKLRMGQILDTGMYRMAEKYLSTDSIYSTDEDDKELEIWNGINMFYIAGEYELFHCFGDPSMMMRTKNPTTFSNACVKMDPNTKRCTVSTGEGPAYISFYDKNNGKTECYYGTSAEFQFSDIHYVNNVRGNNLIGFENVIISGPNKIPYIVNEWRNPERFGKMTVNGSNLHIEYSLNSNSIAYVLMSSVTAGITLKTICDTSAGFVDIDLSKFSSGPLAITLVLNNEIIASETYQYIK